MVNIKNPFVFMPGEIDLLNQMIIVWDFVPDFRRFLFPGFSRNKYYAAITFILFKCKL